MSARRDAKMTAQSKYLAPNDQLMVAINLDVDHEAACAQMYGLGAEVQVLGLPTTLDGDLRAHVARIKKVTDTLSGPIGFHGPFIDMAHYSSDGEIRAVCRKRYHQAFDLAEELGAEYVLFHSQYNPIIRVSKYRRMYHEGNLKFWPEFIERAESLGIPIYLENMFDDTPGPICDIVQAFGTNTMQLCLDIAHAVIFSDLKLSDWIAAYGGDLGHVHINDCNGETDDHLGLGMGSLDLDDALSQLRATGRPLRYVLETGEHTEASLRYLGVEKAASA